ncbi:unnamed protein product [Brugia timori]|uniref:Bm9560 n=2 Tax=Brugia TaxID=6278 RepID=A0A0I9N924_BRUMA|nr:Bm9560 [Brugia malayi]VDO36919.1 unnamed protein product [Brugia timori]
MLWKSSDSTPAELVVDDSAKDDRQIMSNSYVLIYLSLGLDSSTMYILKFSGRNEAPVAKAKDLTIILLASVVFLDGSESSDDEGIIR